MKEFLVMCFQFPGSEDRAVRKSVYAFLIPWAHERQAVIGSYHPKAIMLGLVAVLLVLVLLCPTEGNSRY